MTGVPAAARYPWDMLEASSDTVMQLLIGLVAACGHQAKYAL